MHLLSKAKISWFPFGEVKQTLPSLFFRSTSAGRRYCHLVVRWGSRIIIACPISQSGLQISCRTKQLPFVNLSTPSSNRLWSACDVAGDFTPLQPKTNRKEEEENLPNSPVHILLLWGYHCLDARRSSEWSCCSAKYNVGGTLCWDQSLFHLSCLGGD